MSAPNINTSQLTDAPQLKHFSLTSLLYKKKAGKAAASLPPSPFPVALPAPLEIPTAGVTHPHPGANSKREGGMAFDVPGEFMFPIIVPWTD